jgi:glycosyltransferase involved in cell wall biosynthesis
MMDTYAVSRQPTESKRLSIVIPALNEKEGIEKTIQAIPKEQLQGMGYDVEVVVVDNGSEDQTGELARRAGAEVVFEPRRGYGSAFKAGFSHAKGDIIATADADATYPVEELTRLVEILEDEALDFLTTNRFAFLESGAMSIRHRLGNNMLALATRILFGLNMRDPESGMWVFSRGILSNLKLTSDSWPFSHEIKIEACYFNKCRWKEVAIPYRARSGQTKLLSGWKVGLVDLLHLVKKRISR